MFYGELGLNDLTRNFIDPEIVIGMTEKPCWIKITPLAAFLCYNRSILVVFYLFHFIGELIAFEFARINEHSFGTDNAERAVAKSNEILI